MLVNSSGGLKPKKEDFPFKILLNFYQEILQSLLNLIIVKVL